ncbi:DNA ligase 1-like [Paramacrobiotus metropolitanus]|uniref:DNA ligase 1-like n=1 Tax=Paramacrobiotus metropolitanus TaxID=2943436 RepID=UPI00244597E8|nr:DNA ligase 1-like [Paramacrobiotus metropolitanus]XP_055334442.1 DNA ligase 1-like [Paramacrobiotus metropolitanus]
MRSFLSRAVITVCAPQPFVGYFWKNCSLLVENRSCRFTMAQTSITSFFTKSSDAAKKSPLKPGDKSEANAGKTSATSDNRESQYDPSAESYDPLTDACWQKGEKTPYIALAKTFDTIEKISSRLTIIRTMRNFFRSVILLSPDDLVRCLYLSLNKIAPSWEGLELGVGDSIVMKAIADATGKTVPELKKLKEQEGDLGSAAALSRNTQRTLVASKKLTIENVFQKFREISKISGNASQKRKIQHITSMLVAGKPVEAKFIVRACKGGMRIGLAEKSALIALAHAALMVEQDDGKKKAKDDNIKKAEETIKNAFNEYPDYDFLVSALLRGGLDEVQRVCRIRAGIPVKPMLAHPSKGIDLVMARLGDLEFVVEYKYDGERLQVHKQDTAKITMFSRNQEDHTQKFPELVARIPTHLKAGVESFVLDSEVVAWDLVEKKILPFQVLSTRKRKNVGEAKDVTVQVCVYAFDLLYFNGESLISTPLRRRQELLRENFIVTPGEFMLAQSLVSSDPEALQIFMQEAIQNSCEGLMVKALDKPYEISKRSNNWLKLKKDYLDTIGDTVDVTVIGAFFGSGKRAGTFGSYICAVYDPDRNEYQTLCKLATGLSDENLETFTKFFQDKVISKPLHTYRQKIKPDVWFEPVQVWEIKGADLSVSPVHTAGIGRADPEKGISLRFPRFIKIRNDKQPEDSTTGDEIFGLYRDQAARQEKSKEEAVASDDDDE